jgi:hypothetical protein
MVARYKNESPDGGAWMSYIRIQRANSIIRPGVPPSPQTTALREIGWDLAPNELSLALAIGKPLLPTVAFPIPAGGSAGGPTAEGLKIAKRKEKTKAKEEKKHSSTLPERSLCLEAPVTKKSCE